MRLSPEQIERFFAIWKPLILYVNRRLNVEPAMLNAKVDESWDHRQVFAIREALWANDAIREAFVAENPANLAPADLAIVESWRYRVAGMFCVFRHLKKHSLLIKDGEVYAVLGLASSLDELVPFTPCYVRAVLLPFEDQVIYDSLLEPFNVYLGPGIRRDLEATYRDARERGAIITSLLPRPESPEEEQAEAGEVNARVLDAFRKHLYRIGLSPKVVERDVAAAAVFAADFLAARPEPRSLRNFGTREVRAYLKHLEFVGWKESQCKQSRTALTRLLRFLRDTGRMDPWDARDLLGLLKGREPE
jgi:hypothetical protein